MTLIVVAVILAAIVYLVVASLKSVEKQLEDHW